MSLMQPGALQLPSNQQLRNVVLSYLLYHGHKDTARVFAAEIARREESESVERCPLWQTQDSVAEAEGQMDTSDTVATHAPSSARETDSQPTNAIISPPTNSNDTHRRERRTLENILADVEARRRIRHTILSGRIEGAIELIAQHSPDFLPVNPPTNLARSPKTKLQPGSHAPSVPTPSPPSSTSPVLAPSRSPTPVSSQPQTTTAPEKASQKADVPTSSSLEAGSPELVDSNEGQTQTHSSGNPNSPSLARSVDPVHILFNLRVQQFVEAVRTVPLLPSKEHGEGWLRQDANPTKPEGTDADAEMHSPDWGLVGHGSEDTSIRHNGATPIAQNDLPPEARQKRLFELASGLYQNVAALGCEADRKVYAKEVEQVCSLMLGPSPENSLAAPYLSMSRREALADQVNSAMLWHVGEPPAPRLQIWAQTTKVAWDQVKAMRPTLHKGTEVPADVRMYTKYVLRNAEGDEQGQSQTVIPFDFQALALA